MRRATAALRISLLAMSLLPQATAITLAQDDKGVSEKWESAEKQWAEFSHGYLEKMRILDSQDRDGQPARSKRSLYRTFVEIRSPLMTKYLLDYRVFSDAHAVFLLRKDGEIVSLGDGAWSVYVEKEGALMRNPKLSEFLASRGIVVPDASVAIDIMNLSQELSGGPEAVAYFRSGSDDFLILDKRILRSLLSGVLDWKHTAEKLGDRWLVRSTYTGPPADVAEPATFVVAIDSHGVLSGVFQMKTHP